MEPFVNVLPVDFDGNFYFTNPSTKDFTGLWGKKAYTYPAMTTSKMVILDATPLEVQNIRKKFAKDLAQQMFFESEQGVSMSSGERVNNMPQFNSIHMARSYSDTDLAPFIQKCLDPLPVAQAIVTDAPAVKTEENLTRDEEGQFRTVAIDKKTSLRAKALQS